MTGPPKQKARSAFAKRAFRLHEHALAAFIGPQGPRPQAEHQIGAEPFNTVSRRLSTIGVVD
jgi:hypothetical protein